MTSPSSNSSERAVSFEYLKEYGGLLTDVSTLVEAIDKRFSSQDEEETFSIENMIGSLTVPEQVSREVGVVQSATVTYSHQENGATTVELYGEESVYYASRLASDTVFTDSIIAIKPLDTISSFFLGTTDKAHLPHNLEASSDFEERIKHISGISSADFTLLLINLAQPEQPISPDMVASEPKSAFDPLIKNALIETTRTTSLAQSGSIDYTFLADTSARLSYFYEHGHPSHFHFQCLDGKDEQLRIRGTIDESISLDFPRHVVARGHGQDAVDTTRSISLTLAEIKHIRSVIADEIESLPSDMPADETFIDADGFADTHMPSTESIDIIVDNRREEETIVESAQLAWLNDEFTTLFKDENGDAL